MENYVYIIAGLPELTLSFDNSNFSYESAKNYFFEQLDNHDRQVIALMEEGFNEETLDKTFYDRALTHSNQFIRNYFDFDLHVRNMKVKYLGKRLDKNVSDYLIATDHEEFEDKNRVQEIFDMNDFVAREQQMDKLRWAKVSEIVRMEYFSLNVILAFLVKAKIVQRWSGMDKNKGKEMFEMLVQDIKHIED